MPFREMTRDRAWLLPPTLDELIPADHPARFVAEFVDTLDREEWADLGVDINGEAMGAPAYHPSALLSVWLYGFMTNVRSCRKLEAACRDQLPCLWLTGWQHPDHNTLWRFYQKHRRSMRTLFRRTVRTAVTLELVDLAVQAVDGTKVHANVAHTRSLNTEQLNALLERTERAIAELEAQNEAGDDPAPARLPERLTDRETLRRRVRQARQALDELAVRKRNKNRINLTDPDARALKVRQGAITGYNAQAMVSPLAGKEENGMIVTAVDIADSVNDAGSLTTMLERAEEETGVRTPLTLADAGYHAGPHLAASEQRDQRVVMPDRWHRVANPYHKNRFVYDEATDSYRCPNGERLSFVRPGVNKGVPIRLYLPASASVCTGCPAFGVCTPNAFTGRQLQIRPHEPSVRRHRLWMETQEAQQAYRRRAPLIEPLFGILKTQMGAWRFTLRGLREVEAEWTLLATAFNLRTLWRLWRGRTLAGWSPDPVPGLPTPIPAA